MNKTEDKSLNDNIKKNETFYIICHNCKKINLINNVITCTGINCGENYCLTCLKNIYYKNKEIKEIIEESKENGWICFKCQNKCLCDKCNPKKEKFIDNVVIEIPSQDNLLSNSKKINKPKEIIFDIKKITKNRILKIIPNPTNEDALLVQSLYNNQIPKLDVQEMKFPYIPSQNKINSRLRSKLIKVAKLCEHYYRHKCKVEIFNKECLICHENEFHTNELLRFKNSDDFLNYLRYCILCMNETLNYKKQLFTNNKKEIIKYVNEYEDNIVEWEFHNPKTLCKLCIFKILNSKNCLSTLKKVLKDKFNGKIENKDDILYFKTKEKKCLRNLKQLKNNENNIIYNNKSDTNIINNNEINFINNYNNIQNPNLNLDYNNKTFLTFIFKDKIIIIKKLYENLQKALLDFKINTSIINSWDFVNHFPNNLTNYNNINNSFEFLQNKYENIKNIEQKLNENLLSYSNDINEFITYVYANRIIKNIPESIINKILILKLENSKIFERVSELIKTFNFSVEMYFKILEIKINNKTNEEF